MTARARIQANRLLRGSGDRERQVISGRQIGLWDKSKDLRDTALRGKGGVSRLKRAHNRHDIDSVSSAQTSDVSRSPSPVGVHSRLGRTLELPQRGAVELANLCLCRHRIAPPLPSNTKRIVKCHHQKSGTLWQLEIIRSRQHQVDLATIVKQEPIDREDEPEDNKPSPSLSLLSDTRQNTRDHLMASRLQSVTLATHLL